MKTQLSRYKNKLWLKFAERGENFTLDVPHYKKWLAVIRFLKKRGFKVSENQLYVKEYACLSKYHKIGFKKQVACLLEIGADRIDIQFGHIKNLWNTQQSFWDNPSDERYTQLTYLEGLSVELEVKRLIVFCEKFNVEFEDRNIKLPPNAYIIDNLKNNTHIHGTVKTLDDIKTSIESGRGMHNQGYNSDDKNKKKIICGQTKYFYDYRTKRLSCGVVWHHINNMWWVIVNNQLRNVACFELFDFDASLPKRLKLSGEAKVRKLNGILAKWEANREYERCIVLRNYLQQL